MNDMHKIISIYLFFPDKLSDREILLAELKFSLLLNEMYYNNELAELLSLSRRYVLLKFDELPLFNRRHIVILVKRR